MAYYWNGDGLHGVKKVCNLFLNRANLIWEIMLKNEINITQYVNVNSK